MSYFTNRVYKDRLFVYLFGKEERKEWTLQLYNAVNGTSYTDPDDLTINTLDNIVYIKMHNDVSFIIDNQINIYEHQASYNPNMPLRMLLYISELYTADIRRNEKSLYSSSLIPLKRPYFVVFYNGLEKNDDETELRLSDSFDKTDDPQLDLKVRVININYGHNTEFLKSIRPLYEYAWLIEKIRENQDSGLEISQAIDSAIMMLPEDFVIRKILTAERVEVIDMLLWEYDEEYEKRCQLRDKERADLEAKRADMEAKRADQETKKADMAIERANQLEIMNNQLKDEFSKEKLKHKEDVERLEEEIRLLEESLASKNIN